MAMLPSTRLRNILATLQSFNSLSESLASAPSLSNSLADRDTEVLALQDKIADPDAEVLALQDKIAALLAASRDADAAHSKAVSQKDAQISTLRARVVELEGRVDEPFKEKEHEEGGSEEKAPYVAKALT